MFNFLSFLMPLLHSIPFKNAIHFPTCITLDLISLSSVPLVSKITPNYYYYYYYYYVGEIIPPPPELYLRPVLSVIVVS